MQGIAKAMIVNCATRPTLLGLPILGHIGWGFQYPDGKWCAGSMEGNEWPQGNHFNGIWVREVGSFEEAIQTFADMILWGAPYTTYKMITVTPNVWPDLAGAEAQVRRAEITRYDVFKYNCLDAVYDILAVFGRNSFSGAPLPHPAQRFTPNDWYGNLHAIGHHYLPPPAAMRTTFSFQGLSHRCEPGALPSWRVPGSPDYFERPTDFSGYAAMPVIPPLGGKPGQI